MTEFWAFIGGVCIGVFGTLVTIANCRSMDELRKAKEER